MEEIMMFVKKMRAVGVVVDFHTEKYWEEEILNMQFTFPDGTKMQINPNADGGTESWLTIDEEEIHSNST